MLETLDHEKKRLKFRSWHRGTKEMDMLLGQFWDAHMDQFDAKQTAEYARLLKNSDPDLYNWISGNEPLPPSEDSAVMQMLMGFKLKSFG